MGDTHFRSNILEQGDESLKIKFTNASFTNMTVTNLSGDSNQHIATLTSNNLNATTGTIKTITSVTKASLTNVTATSMVVKNASFTTAHITTGKMNALTATAVTIPTSITVNASSGFKIPTAGVAASVTLAVASPLKPAVMLRVDVGATPYYCKLFRKA